MFFFVTCSNVFSFDPQSASFSVNAESKDINSITEVQKINQTLDRLERDWNLHEMDKVLSFYSQDFINGDGLSLDAVKNLTQELWDAYPDIKTKTQERTVRVYGDYATVESLDHYYGESTKIRPEVGSKGILKAVSVGNLFLKKLGPAWKITSDKTLFEKVSIGYGIGSELVDEGKIKLSAPEQVASGQQYTASIDFNLTDEIKPVAAISKEILIYPHSYQEDKFRLVNELNLEKLLTANKISKNELITATIGLTGGALKPKLLGLVFLTRRVNVIPVSGTTSEVSIIKSPARSALSREVDYLDIYEDIQKEEQEKNKEIQERKDLENELLQDSE